MYLLGYEPIVEKNVLNKMLLRPLPQQLPLPQPLTPVGLLATRMVDEQKDQGSSPLDLGGWLGRLSPMSMGIAGSWMEYSSYVWETHT